LEGHKELTPSNPWGASNASRGLPIAKKKGKMALKGERDNFIAVTLGGLEDIKVRPSLKGHIEKNCVGGK